MMIMVQTCTHYLPKPAHVAGHLYNHVWNHVTNWSGSVLTTPPGTSYIFQSADRHWKAPPQENYIVDLMAFLQNHCTSMWKRLALRAFGFFQVANPAITSRKGWDSQHRDGCGEGECSDENGFQVEMHIVVKMGLQLSGTLSNCCRADELKRA